MAFRILLRMKVFVLIRNIALQRQHDYIDTAFLFRFANMLIGSLQQVLLGRITCPSLRSDRLARRRRAE